MTTQFSAGGVLSRTFTIWLQNFIPFTLLSLIVQSPVVIYTVILMNSSSISPDAAQTWVIVTSFLPMILGLITTGAVTYGVFEQLRGNSAGLGRCLSIGLARMLLILGIGFVAGFLMLLGLIALLIPGLIIMCIFWVAVPAGVVEGCGVTTALSRSAELTRGSRWSIFAIVLVLGLIGYFAQYAIQTVLETNPEAFMLATVLIGVLSGTLSAVAGAVAYHDLRVSKEGVGIEQLIKVFE